MDGVKSWLQSKGVIGGLIATAAPILMMFGSLLGFDVTPSDIQEASGIADTLQAAALTIVSAVGGMVAIWGRLTATKKIG